MSEYQTPKDRAYVDSLLKSAKKEAAAFLNLKHTAERSDGSHGHAPFRGSERELRFA